MENKKGLNVYSEIGKLKTVLLHRPGLELENITPSYMERLLFDDIPFLEIAQEEHDAFANVLRKNGVEVLYLSELTQESIQNDEIKEAFIQQFLDEANIIGAGLRHTLYDYLKELPLPILVSTMMAGIKKSELPQASMHSLADYVNRDYPFAFDSMPNLYFTRDPFATIGNGITLNKMRTVTRSRETIFAQYIFNHHPRFKEVIVPRYYDRSEQSAIEGGDELILSEKVLAVGISLRTDAESIEKLARRLFQTKSGFETILAFEIPKSRAFMHLDTVFTMVDYDKFTIHPGIEGPLNIYSLTQDGKDILISLEHLTLEDVLKKYLELDAVTLIRCAGGESIAAEREQWNDGSNTLAIAPGEVIVYSRNRVTNKMLEEAGIKVHVIPSSELSRGRGGPRCMSMPLYREPLKLK